MSAFAVVWGNASSTDGLFGVNYKTFNINGSSISKSISVNNTIIGINDLSISTFNSTTAVIMFSTLIASGSLSVSNSTQYAIYDVDGNTISGPKMVDDDVRFEIILSIPVEVDVNAINSSAFVTFWNDNNSDFGVVSTIYDTSNNILK